MSAYTGYCEPCDWTGPERTDSLRSLADYDRHLAGRVHQAMLQGEGMPKPGELVAVPGEDMPSTIVEVITVDPGPNDIEVTVDIGFGHTERIWVRPTPDEEHGHRIWQAL